MLDRSVAEQLTKEQLIDLVLSLQQRVAALEDKLEAKSGPGDPPPFVRASVRRKQQKQERKQRAQSFVRRREQPTQVCFHAASRCPDCGRALSGGSEHRRRQIIDLPDVPAQVTDHVVMARWCGVCQKRVLPQVDLSAQTLGQHRFGLRLMALVMSLKTVSRLPVRQITALLLSLWGIKMSAGEVCELLHDAADQGKEAYEQLRQQVRGSPFVHADETGWREDGRNGYLWSFSTPEVHYFHYDKSRSGSVAVEVLGEDFGGICISDFYGGYNQVGGVRQRCWVHLLRDVHHLTEAHPEDAAVQSWAQEVRAVYDAARTWQEQAREAACRYGPDAGSLGYGVFDRQRQRRQLEARLYALAEPCLGRDVPKDAPLRVLCQRIANFLPELLAFVEYVFVPSQNNAAERSVRPLVIARKISGGTRSGKGSKTKCVLSSLVGTWQAQGQDVLASCQRLLLSAAPAA